MAGECRIWQEKNYYNKGKRHNCHSNKQGRTCATLKKKKCIEHYKMVPPSDIIINSNHLQTVILDFIPLSFFSLASSTRHENKIIYTINIPLLKMRNGFESSYNNHKAAFHFFMHRGWQIFYTMRVAQGCCEGTNFPFFFHPFKGGSLAVGQKYTVKENGSETYLSSDKNKSNKVQRIFSPCINFFKYGYRIPVLHLDIYSSIVMKNDKKKKNEPLIQIKTVFQPPHFDVQLLDLN